MPDGAGAMEIHTSFITYILHRYTIAIRQIIDKATERSARRPGNAIKT